MIEIYEGPLPKPEPNELVVTRNLEPKDLRFLALEEFGRQLFSDDSTHDAPEINPGEDTARNIEAVYAAVSMALPEQFASLAVQTGKSFNPDVLR